VADAVARIVQVYIEQRTAPSESFTSTYERLGKAPFKERVYATDH